MRNSIRSSQDVRNKISLPLARKLSDMGVSMWIRHVLVPERNDRDDYLHRLAILLQH